MRANLLDARIVIGFGDPVTSHGVDTFRAFTFGTFPGPLVKNASSFLFRPLREEKCGSESRESARGAV